MRPSLLLQSRIGEEFEGPETEDAISYYNKAIEINPNNENAYNNRGNLKKTKGDFDGAISDFTEGIEIDPKIALIYKNRSDAEEAKGNIAGAKRCARARPKSTRISRADKDVGLKESNVGADLGPRFCSAEKGHRDTKVPPTFSRRSHRTTPLQAAPNPISI